MCGPTVQSQRGPDLQFPRDDRLALSALSAGNPPLLQHTAPVRSCILLAWPYTRMDMTLQHCLRKHIGTDFQAGAPCLADCSEARGIFLRRKQVIY
jgi:hypothetical protein